MCGVSSMLPTSSAACATTVAPPGPGRVRVAARLVFQVEDLEAMRARLLDREVDVSEPVEDMHEPARRCREEPS